MIDNIAKRKDGEIAFFDGESIKITLTDTNPLLESDFTAGLTLGDYPSDIACEVSQDGDNVVVNFPVDLIGGNLIYNYFIWYKNKCILASSITKIQSNKTHKNESNI